MKIIDTKFMQGVVDETAILYDGIPQVAFIGRSNVGKSSTLNALTGKRRLVKVGQTPGKTREINFFEARIESNDGGVGSVYLVDLPGYGYAKLSKQQRNQLKQLILWYLEHPKADTALVCIVIDAKVGLTEYDREIIDVLRAHRKKFIIAVNKVDKLNQKSRHKLVQSLTDEFGESVPYILYSASTNKHINVLRDAIFNGI